MKGKNEKEIEVIVEGDPDLTQVPKGIMEAFIDLLAEEITKIKPMLFFVNIGFS